MAALETTPARDPLRVWNNRGHRVDLCDVWRGCPAFYCGGGPSLKNVDTATWRKRGILSLAINNAAAAIHSTAFICGDPVDKMSDAIWLDPTIIKFLPLPRYRKNSCLRAKRDGEFYWLPLTVRQAPNTFFFDRDVEMDPAEFFTRPTATWGTSGRIKNRKRPKLLNTLFMGFRLLHYLGVRDVYLVGMDFSMSETAKYGFEQGRDANAIVSCNHLFTTTIGELEHLKPYFDSAGFRVYQTVETSNLRVFPYRSLSEAVIHATAALPEEQPDLAGWYETKNTAKPWKDWLQQRAA